MENYICSKIVWIKTLKTKKCFSIGRARAHYNSYREDGPSTTSPSIKPLEFSFSTQSINQINHLFEMIVVKAVIFNWIHLLLFSTVHFL